MTIYDALNARYTCFLFLDYLLMARRVFSAPVVTTVAVLLAFCTEGEWLQCLDGWVVNELVPGQSWYSMAASACRHPVFQGPPWIQELGRNSFKRFLRTLYGVQVSKYTLRYLQVLVVMPACWTLSIPMYYYGLYQKSIIQVIQIYVMMIYPLNTNTSPENLWLKELFGRLSTCIIVPIVFFPLSSSRSLSEFNWYEDSESPAIHLQRTLTVNWNYLKLNEPKDESTYCPKDHWTLKNCYFEDPTPAIQVQSLPLEGPRSLGC